MNEFMKCDHNTSHLDPHFPVYRAFQYVLGDPTVGYSHGPTSTGHIPRQFVGNGRTKMETKNDHVTSGHHKHVPAYFGRITVNCVMGPSVTYKEATKTGNTCEHQFSPCFVVSAFIQSSVAGESRGMAWLTPNLSEGKNTEKEIYTHLSIHIIHSRVLRMLKMAAHGDEIMECLQGLRHLIAQPGLV
jgi:hypothetical protein